MPSCQTVHAETREPWRFPNGFVDDALYYWEGQQRYERLIADGQVDAADEVAGLYNLAHQQELSGFTLESFARDYDAARLEDAARATKTLPGDHNMKRTPTPRTHVGVIAETSVVTFGPTGGMKYEVTVPAGTRCAKLDGGSDPWVVDDLRFLGDRNSVMYHDADHYGIRIPEENIVGIVPRGTPVPFSAMRERVRAEMHGAPGIRPDPGYVEQVKARLIVERIKDFSDAEVDRCLKHTVAVDGNMRVLAWMWHDGLTIDKLYEGVKVDQDQIFNTLVSMGQDASLEDAKAISEKMTPQDHKDFCLSKSPEGAQAVLRQAMERPAVQVSLNDAAAPASAPSKARDASSDLSM